MPAPAAGNYPAYFGNYIRLVDANSVAEAIEKYSSVVTEFIKKVPSDKVDFSYAEGKWSIKEMLQHIIDTERIFAYRALAIARHDKSALPGFDEKLYAIASNASSRNWQDLLNEFEAVRKSTDLLLHSFTLDDLLQSGTTNEHPNTANAISFMIFGHILHHINVLKERYL